MHPGPEDRSAGVARGFLFGGELRQKLDRCDVEHVSPSWSRIRARMSISAASVRSKAPDIKERLVERQRLDVGVTSANAMTRLLTSA